MRFHRSLLLLVSISPMPLAAQSYRSFSATAEKLASAGGTILKSTMNEAARVTTVYGPPAVSISKKFVTEDIPGTAGSAATWARGNLALAAWALVGTVGLVGVAAPAAVSGAALSATGFGAGGIQGGSLAAGLHATIGNVASGSGFAILQSAGAGGAGAAVVSGITQVGSGLMALGGAGAGWFKSTSG